MANNISVSVVGDVRDINNKLGNVEKQLGGFGKSIGKVGSLLKGAFVFAAGATVVGQLKGVVTAASDLNETLSKSKTIFGPAAADIEKFGNNAAKSLGLSKEEAISGAAAFGNFFDQIGIGKKASADMSKSFLQMSADLASFNNADPSKVMEAFQAATRGEYDSLQQFIPTVNAAKVETEALAQTHKKSAKQLTDADKANALYSLSVKGMGKAQGDFARTSGGAANQQRILSATMDDIKAKIGTSLLPIWSKLLSFTNSKVIPGAQKLGAAFQKDALPKLKEFGTWVTSTAVPAIKNLVVAVTPLVKNIGTGLVGAFQALLPKVQELGTWIKDVLIPALVSFTGFLAQHQTAVTNVAIGLGILVAGYKAMQLTIAAVSAVTSAYATVTGLVTAAQNAATAASLGTRLGLIALNVQMVATRVATAIWTGVQWLLNASMYAFPLVWIVAAIVAVIAIIVLAIKYHKQIAAAVVTAWNAVKKATITAWNAVKNAIVTAWNSIKSAVSTALNAVKSAMGTAWNSVKSGTTSAWNAVKTAIATAWNGIKSAVGTAINSVVSLAKGIGKKVLGAIGDFGGLLKNAGRKIIQGLIDGITGMIGSLKDKLSGITNLIPDWKGPMDKDKRLLTPAGQAIMDGLIKGIDKKLPALRKILGKVSGVIATGVNAEFAPGFGPGKLVTGGRHTPAGNIYLTVNAPVGSNSALIGKEVVGHLQAYVNTYGKRTTRNLV